MDRTLLRNDAAAPLSSSEELPASDAALDEAIELA
jgi:hypothetical protein